MMRANAVAYRPEPVEMREREDENLAILQPSLMTPARRAGLEALEREFSEFLKTQPR